MTTIGRLARELAIGAPLVHLQLVASRLYEEIRDELERTPASDGAKVGLLAAAVERCRRSTSFGIAPAVIVSELEVVIRGTIQAWWRCVMAQIIHLSNGKQPTERERFLLIELVCAGWPDRRYPRPQRHCCQGARPIFQDRDRRLFAYGG